VRILLVEDDENLTRWLAEALTNQHHTVDEASDGQAGWELAESLEYDLILLDVMLPQLDGISFCQRLRQRGDRARWLQNQPRFVLSPSVVGTREFRARASPEN
jgi:two-component system OmpR family response regulator